MEVPNKTISRFRVNSWVKSLKIMRKVLKNLGILDFWRKFL